MAEDRRLKRNAEPIPWAWWAAFWALIYLFWVLPYQLHLPEEPIKVRRTK